MEMEETMTADQQTIKEKIKKLQKEKDVVFWHIIM